MNRRIGIVLSYIMMLFEILSTLLLTPFILRSLGQAEYGVYKLALSITAYLLLLDLGIGNAITKYISQFRVRNEVEQSCKFLGVATVFYFGIALLSIICGIIIIIIFPRVFAKGLTNNEIILAKHLLSITIVNVAVTLGTTAYNNIIISYEQFAISKGVAILGILLRMILTVITLTAVLGSISIVSINLFITIATRSFYVWYVTKKIGLIPSFHKIEWSFIREIVIYSSLILLQMIATQINATTDQILIGSLVQASSTTLAIYGIGAQVTQYFQSIGSAFSGVLMPGIVRLIENRLNSKQITEEMIRIGRINFSVLVLIWGGFLVCGKQFIVLWAGPENGEAYKVSIILMTAYLFILTESVGTQILWAMNQHREQAYLKFGIVLINIILSVFLIQWEPLIGATIGTFLSLVMGDIVVLNVIFAKKIKLNLFHYYYGLFKGILPCLIIAVSTGFILELHLTGTWLSLLLNITLIFLIYSYLMFRFGFNSYEKSLISSMFKGIHFT